MSKKLESYLQEIERYLALREGKEEILLTIKSYLIEKVEDQHGEITEAGIEEAITAYGTPRAVAERYLEGEGVTIIAPALKNFLFLYTGLMFAIHLGATTLAVVLKQEVWLLPFIPVQGIGFWQFLLYLPSAFLFDFGAVSLGLYVLSQSKRAVKLPWFTGVKQVTKPRVTLLVLLGAVLGIFTYFHVQYEALFVNINLITWEVKALPNAIDLNAASWIVLGMVVIAMVGYAVRFFWNSEWIILLQSVAALACQWYVVDAPFGVVTLGKLFAVVTMLTTIRLVLAVSNLHIRMLDRY